MINRRGYPINSSANSAARLAKRSWLAKARAAWDIWARVASSERRRRIAAPNSEGSTIAPNSGRITLRAPWWSRHTAGRPALERFQQGQPVAFVARRKHVQVGKGEEGALSFAGDVTGEHYFGSAESRGFRFESSPESYGLA